MYSMIARLTGTVVDITPTHVVLDVSGVGYAVAVRSTAPFTHEQSVSLYTYLAVRETALDIYGFHTKDEQEIFELLLTLPKIGPKSAMHILAQADIALLKKAVVAEDPTYLSKMSGIGKKSAEKIVAGLKEKIDHISTETETTDAETDVIDALVALGYSQTDARAAVQQLPSDITDTTTRITKALKLLT